MRLLGKASSTVWKPSRTGVLASNNKSIPAAEISSNEISILRRRSLRNGAWFHGLTRMERGIIDLTLRCVGFVRSRLLERVLREITGKLRYVLDHLYILRLEAIGRPIAERICAAAASMGVCGAERWKDDTSYIQLLGLNRLYSSG